MPQAAVSYFVGVAKVFVVSNGRVQERNVRLGERRGDAVEVLEGVKAGEAVATSDLAQLHEGAQVRTPPQRALNAGTPAHAVTDVPDLTPRGR